MNSNLDQLTADAMKLPLRDRVQLAQRLVSTLMMKSRVIRRICGLRKLSGGLKNFAAERFRVSVPKTRSAKRAKLSSEEGHLPSGGFQRDHRSGEPLIQSGVALRLPPHSKICRPLKESVGKKSSATFAKKLLAHTCLLTSFSIASNGFCIPNFRDF